MTWMSYWIGLSWGRAAGLQGTQHACLSTAQSSGQPSAAHRKGPALAWACPLVEVPESVHLAVTSPGRPGRFAGLGSATPPGTGFLHCR